MIGTNWHYLEFYLPLGRSHALKKGLTKLISFPLLNRILISIIRVIARFTDAEIAVLEKKLERYKMVKQGMMQNLLTGKIRLIQYR
ncbi:MAG: hypothetical protein JRI92_14285 [Deltaproteobacteria bacterium]|jgi:type I restriction enzyme S subunit|nr:hypothetical protein [Deltaproteobacteria bacterium]